MSWLMAGATLGAGALSSAGQLAANKQNLQFTSDANDTQVHLANTAHQREVRDLIAAGLNPILSAQGSGAAVPSLGSINSQNAGQGLSDGISSATKFGSSHYRAQVDSIKANTEQVNTVNSALKADREVADLDRRTDHILAEARFDAARRLTGHEDNFKDGKLRTTFNKKTYDDYVNLIKGGMLSDAKMRDNMNWRANLSSFIPFISPAGISSATDAYHTLKFKPRYFK